MNFLNDILNNFQNKLNIDENLPETFKPLEKSALDGDVEAQVNLACEYLKGKSIKKNIPRALILFKSAAEKKDAMAQFYLGLCYHMAIGVNRDLRQAEKWYEKSAENANEKSIINLSIIRQNSKCSHDFDKAVDLLKNSASYLPDTSMYNLALNFLEDKNINEALSFLKASSSKNSVSSLKKLAEIYSNGKYIKKDYKKAFMYYQKAASLGDTQSLLNLGICYINGLGTQKDENMAVSCFKKAALKNYPPAIYNLGLCYLRGIIFNKNYHLACCHFKKAADLGYKKASKMLKECFSKESFIINTKENKTAPL